MAKVNIQCSRCGASREFDYRPAAVDITIGMGCGSCGSALYCPECTKTWAERNGSREMGGGENTAEVIFGWFERQHLRAARRKGMS